MKWDAAGKSVGLGALLSMLVTMIGCGIAGLLISMEAIDSRSMDYCVVAILLGASIIGAKTAIARTDGKRIITAILVAGVYLVSLLAVTALFFEGQYRGVGYTMLIVLSGAIAAAITGINRKKRNIFRKSKIKHR